MSTPAPGGISAALDHLIAEHAAAGDWADELAYEVEALDGCMCGAVRCEGVGEPRRFAK